MTTTPNEWPVVALADEEKAKKRVEDAERRAAHMKTDYTGTTYYYFTVELIS